MGQGSVVRSDNVLPGPGPHHNAPPVSAHPRVHHRDKDRMFRPVADGLNQPVAGLPESKVRGLCSLSPTEIPIFNRITGKIR